MTKRPHIPQDLPPGTLDWKRLAPFASKATAALARYDGTLTGIINPAVLLSPVTDREAVLSSQIEGTQATLMEVLRHEAGEQYPETKKGEINEIINYRRALLTGEKYLEERPITLQLIRELHGILMKDVRGGDKTPGQFRREQNWIGKKNTPLAQARFVPPAPEIVDEHLEKLQTFISGDYADPLVQMALIHAQFEIIHPFKDGNGRLGRMLIPLFLYQKRALQRPMFYLSEYLEETDREYRNRLLAITEEGDWQGWAEFFLTAIHIQAQSNNTKAQAILSLYENMKIAFRDTTRSQYAQAALDAFFDRPIMNSPDFMSRAGIANRGTANSILKALEDAGLIKTLRAGSGQTSSIFAFPQLINAAEGKQVIDI